VPQGVQGLERRQTHDSINLRAIIAGILATFFLTLLISGCLALTIYLTTITEQQVTLILYYSGMLTLAVGGGLAARWADTLGWVHGGLAGAVYVILATMVGMYFFPGGYALMSIVQRVLAGFFIAALGGIIGINI
jgi:putative membrane protein (TIGR04086 family)